jgi:hypothetical protein
MDRLALFERAVEHSGHDKTMLRVPYTRLKLEVYIPLVRNLPRSTRDICVPETRMRCSRKRRPVSEIVLIPALLRAIDMQFLSGEKGGAASLARFL